MSLANFVSFYTSIFESVEKSYQINKVQSGKYLFLKILALSKKAKSENNVVALGMLFMLTNSFVHSQQDWLLDMRKLDLRAFGIIYLAVPEHMQITFNRIHDSNFVYTK
ncbi:hypothetical protein O6H91_09G050800 [Diphasiastrum complanatum]|uniref:Uncharacterized protein n=1 Tax=Diphasiastrum complanatum TaxID=34168 RepID=A0ACC2CQ48_DIPCM|nr:hypothetical protein O6H91_09G050800 [Diphasiastrum complanatum]